MMDRCSANMDCCPPPYVYGGGGTQPHYAHRSPQQQPPHIVQSNSAYRGLQYPSPNTIQTPRLYHDYVAQPHPISGGVLSTTTPVPQGMKSPYFLNCERNNRSVDYLVCISPASSVYGYSSQAAQTGFTDRIYGHNIASQWIPESFKSRSTALPTTDKSVCENVSTGGLSPSCKKNILTARSNAVNSTPKPYVSALTGVALEKQLLQATKEELIQTLLELGSCNADAFSFIQTKARFFALRHDFVDDDTEKCPANQGLAECDSVHQPHPARRIFDDEEADDEGDEKSVKREAVFTSTGLEAAAETPKTQQVSAGNGALPSMTKTTERHTNPQQRSFCLETHPCLRWYGACRNSTSCVFACAPQNLCLNWIRGSCAAQNECGGVHRLPDHCPTEILRIYSLNHGSDRGTMLTMESSINKAAPVPSMTKTQSSMMTTTLSKGIPLCSHPTLAVSPSVQVSGDECCRCLTSSFADATELLGSTFCSPSALDDDDDDCKPKSASFSIVDTAISFAQATGLDDMEGSRAPQPRTHTRTHTPM